MKAKKDNKVYRITDSDKKRYLDEGYDIYGDDGNVLEYSPKKKVPFGDYMNLLKENESLHVRVKELEEAAPEKKSGTKKAGE